MPHFSSQPFYFSLTLSFKCLEPFESPLESDRCQNLIKCFYKYVLTSFNTILWIIVFCGFGKEAVFCLYRVEINRTSGLYCYCNRILDTFFFTWALYVLWNKLNLNIKIKLHSKTACSFRCKCWNTYAP